MTFGSYSTSLHNVLLSWFPSLEEFLSPTCQSLCSTSLQISVQVTYNYLKYHSQKPLNWKKRPLYPNYLFIFIVTREITGRFRPSLGKIIHFHIFVRHLWRSLFWRVLMRESGTSNATSAVPSPGNNAVVSPDLDIFVRGWVFQGVYTSRIFLSEEFPFCFLSASTGVGISFWALKMPVFHTKTIESILEPVAQQV